MLFNDKENKKSQLILLQIKVVSDQCDFVELNKISSHNMASIEVKIVTYICTEYLQFVDKKLFSKAHYMAFLTSFSMGGHEFWLYLGPKLGK